MLSRRPSTLAGQHSAIVETQHAAAETAKRTVPQNSAVGLDNLGAEAATDLVTSTSLTMAGFLPSLWAVDFPMWVVCLLAKHPPR